MPGGGHMMVNVGTGNLVLQNDDMTVPNKGVALAYRRTYNSQSQHDGAGSDGAAPSLYGNGWTNTFDAHLSGSSNGTLSLWDIDGARYDYTGSDAAGWSPPPGQHATLTWDGSCGYAWTKKTGTTYYFFRVDAAATCSSYGAQYAGFAGRLSYIYGRNNNTYIQFTYNWDNGNASATGKIADIYATTESGMTTTLQFADVNNRRLLQQLLFPDGVTTVTYGYDANGDLTTVSHPPNNSTGIRPQQAFGYRNAGNDQVLYWAASPRWIAGCPSCGTDGSVVYFGFTGASAVSSTLGAIVHYGFVNPTIPDTTGSGPIQSAYPSTAFTYLTEYFTTGTATPTFRDTDGHMTNWIVDGSGRPTQTQECTAGTNQGQQCLTPALWLSTNEAWDANDNLVSETDARGYETDYAYDAQGNTVAAGAPFASVHTPNGQQTFRPTRLFDYDSNNNVNAYCDERATHLSGHDWVGAGPVVSDTLCSSGAGGIPHATFTFSSQSYEPAGELTAMTSALGYVRHLAYNLSTQGGVDYGLPTDVVGDTIVQQSDGTSRQQYVRYTYDQHGNVVCLASNANDQSTVHTIVYDALNRVTAVADPDDASLSGCTRTPGIPGSTIVAHTTYFPDGSKASTQTAAEAAKGVQTQYTYDIDGNVATELHHFGDVPGTTTKWYDGADRLVEVSQPHDASDVTTYPWMTRYLYDLSAQGTRSSAPLINGVAVSAYGSLFKTVEYMPPTTQGLPTNVYGNPVWIDLRGTAYDGLDRITASYEAAFSAAPKRSNVYDGSGQYGLLTRTTNGSSQVSDFTYDALGRVGAETYSGDSGLTPNRSFVYDVIGKPYSITTTDLGTETHVFDAEGRETTKTEASGGSVDSPGSISHGYYADGTLQTTTIASAAFQLPVALSFSYRADGKLQAQTETDATGPHTFTYAYTGGGRQLRRTDPLNGTTVPSYNGSVTIVPQSYTYDSTGQVSGMTIPRNLAYTAITHDAEGQTTGFNAYQATPSDPSFRQTMAYTVRGELLKQTITNGLKTVSVNHQYSFGFDDTLGRADYRSGQILEFGAATQHLDLTYGYDGSGRMQTSASAALQPSGGGSFSTTRGNYARAYDAQDRFRSESLSGQYINQLDGSYNSSSSEAALTISYWPDGHAAKAISSGSTSSSGYSQTLHWDGDRLLYSVQGALGTVYAGADGAYLYQSGSFFETDVYDRDWSGNAVTSHWMSRGSAYFGAWGGFSVKSFAITKVGTNGKYPVESSINDEVTVPFGAPVLHRTDGYQMDQITLQGVRSFDTVANQWTTPDAYAGDVHDPMTQKPFMWNRNNLYAYMDPSGFGYEPSCDAACAERGNRLGRAIWNFLFGDDIKTVMSASAPLGARALAAASLASTVFDAPVKGIFKGLGLVEKGFGGFTEHGAQQLLGRDGGRGVTNSAFSDALSKPLSAELQVGGTIKVTGKDAVVVLNKDGKVVTTWATNAQGVRSLTLP